MIVCNILCQPQTCSILQVLNAVCETELGPGPSLPSALAYRSVAEVRLGVMTFNM